MSEFVSKYVMKQQAGNFPNVTVIRSPRVLLSPRGADVINHITGTIFTTRVGVFRSSLCDPLVL